MNIDTCTTDKDDLIISKVGNYSCKTYSCNPNEFIFIVSLLLNISLQLLLIVSIKSELIDYLIYTEFFLQLLFITCDFFVHHFCSMHHLKPINLTLISKVFLIMSILSVISLNIGMETVNEWGSAPYINYLLFLSGLILVSYSTVFNVNQYLPIFLKVRRIESDSVQIIWKNKCLIHQSNDVLESMHDILLELEPLKRQLITKFIVSTVIMTYDMIVSIILTRADILSTYSLTNLAWFSSSFLINSFIISHMNTMLKTILKNVDKTHKGILITFGGLELDNLMMFSTLTAIASLLIRLL